MDSPKKSFPEKKSFLKTKVKTRVSNKIVLGTVILVVLISVGFIGFSYLPITAEVNDIDKPPIRPECPEGKYISGLLRYECLDDDKEYKSKCYKDLDDSYRCSSGETCCLVKRDCPTGYTKSTGPDGNYTCCKNSTHVPCKGGICCPGDSIKNNCGYSRTYSTPFCIVTDDQCKKKKTDDGRSYKLCAGRLPAGAKTICCHPDLSCGYVGRLPACVYPNPPGCPDGTFKCENDNVAGGFLCCKTGQEECKPLRDPDDPNDTGNTNNACVTIAGNCDPGEIDCVGLPPWNNNDGCCKPENCFHDTTGYARCMP